MVMMMMMMMMMMTTTMTTRARVTFALKDDELAHLDQSAI